MDNPDLIFYIPENEITDTASFFDAVKKRIIEAENSLGYKIFLRGPSTGICIELVHPDESQPEKTLTIHISFEKFV
jgi:hypothetical protein